MAGMILDRIINETLQKTFGSDVIKENLLKPSANGQTNSIIQNNSLGRNLIAASDTFDEAFKIESYKQLPANVNHQLEELQLLPVEMFHYERLFWVFIFAFMIFISVGGNLIVVYIVSTNKEFKSVTNYFLVNLSMADTMVSTLNVIFNFTSMLNR